MQSVQFTPVYPNAFFSVKMFSEINLSESGFESSFMFLEIAVSSFSFYLGQPYPTPRGLRHYPSCTPEPGPTSAAEQ